MKQSQEKCDNKGLFKTTLEYQIHMGNVGYSHQHFHFFIPLHTSVHVSILREKKSIFSPDRKKSCQNVTKVANSLQSSR